MGFLADGEDGFVLVFKLFFEVFVVGGDDVVGGEVLEGVVDAGGVGGVGEGVVGEVCEDLSCESFVSFAVEFVEGAGEDGELEVVVEGASGFVEDVDFVFDAVEDEVGVEDDGFHRGGECGVSI